MQLSSRTSAGAGSYVVTLAVIVVAVAALGVAENATITPSGTPTASVSLRQPSMTASPTATPLRTNTAAPADEARTVTKAPSASKTTSVIMAPPRTSTPSHTPSRFSQPLRTSTPSKTPSRFSQPLRTSTPTASAHGAAIAMDSVTPSRTPSSLLTRTDAPSPSTGDRTPSPSRSRSGTSTPTRAAVNASHTSHVTVPPPSPTTATTTKSATHRSPTVTVTAPPLPLPPPATPTRTILHRGTSSASHSASPLRSASQTRTASPPATPTTSLTISPAPTPSLTISPSHTVPPTATSPLTQTATLALTASESLTRTLTVSPSLELPPTASVTLTDEGTWTLSRSASFTTTLSFTVTPPPTPTPTPSSTFTMTRSLSPPPTPTATTSVTITATATVTPPPTPTTSATITPPPTPTHSSTTTITETMTGSASKTVSLTRSATASMPTETGSHTQRATLSDSITRSSSLDRPQFIFVAPERPFVWSQAIRTGTPEEDRTVLMRLVGDEFDTARRNRNSTFFFDHIKITTEHAPTVAGRLWAVWWHSSVHASPDTLRIQLLHDPAFRIEDDEAIALHFSPWVTRRGLQIEPRVLFITIRRGENPETAARRAAANARNRTVDARYRPDGPVSGLAAIISGMAGMPTYSLQGFRASVPELLAHCREPLSRSTLLSFAISPIPAPIGQQPYRFYFGALVVNTSVAGALVLVHFIVSAALATRSSSSVTSMGNGSKLATTWRSRSGAELCAKGGFPSRSMYLLLLVAPCTYCATVLLALSHDLAAELAALFLLLPWVLSAMLIGHIVSLGFKAGYETADGALLGLGLPILPPSPARSARRGETGAARAARAKHVALEVPALDDAAAVRAEVAGASTCPRQPFLVRWFGHAGEYFNLMDARRGGDPLFCQRYRFFFSQYTFQFRWFIVEELTVSVLCAVSLGVAKGSHDWCFGAASVVLVLLALHGLIVLLWQPYSRRATNLIIFVLTALQCAGIVVAIAATAEDYQNHSSPHNERLTAAGGIISIVAAALLFCASVFELVVTVCSKTALRDRLRPVSATLLSSREARIRAGVNGAVRDTSGEPASAQELAEMEFADTSRFDEDRAAMQLPRKLPRTGSRGALAVPLLVQEPVHRSRHGTAPGADAIVIDSDAEFEDVLGGVSAIPSTGASTGERWRAGDAEFYSPQRRKQRVGKGGLPRRHQLQVNPLAHTPHATSGRSGELREGARRQRPREAAAGATYFRDRQRNRRRYKEGDSASECEEEEDEDEEEWADSEHDEGGEVGVDEYDSSDYAQWRAERERRLRWDHANPARRHPGRVTSEADALMNILPPQHSGDLTAASDMFSAAPPLPPASAITDGATVFSKAPDRVVR